MSRYWAVQRVSECLFLETAEGRHIFNHRKIFRELPENDWARSGHILEIMGKCFCLLMYLVVEYRGINIFTYEKPQKLKFILSFQVCNSGGVMYVMTCCVWPCRLIPTCLVQL